MAANIIQAGVTLPETFMNTDTPRITPLDPSQWTDEMRELMQLPGHGFVSEKVSGYLATLLRHPGLYRRYAGFAGKLLMKGKLPARARELAILRIGWLCKAPYDWGEHVPIAKKCGITAAEIEQVIEGPGHAAWDTHDRTVVRTADELHSASNVSDATWQELSRHFDDKQLIELLMVIGAYQMISGVQNALRVELPPGNAGLATR